MTLLKASPTILKGHDQDSKNRPSVDSDTVLLDTTKSFYDLAEFYYFDLIPARTQPSQTWNRLIRLEHSPSQVQVESDI